MVQGISNSGSNYYGQIASGSKLQSAADGAAELSIVEGEAETVISVINEMAAQKASEGFKVGIISTDETLERYKAGIVKSIGTRMDEATIANHLYGILREFDDERADCIFSEAFPTEGIGSAIMNRLLKAAGYRVIRV